jgi:hypothetical protein
MNLDGQEEGLVDSSNNMEYVISESSSRGLNLLVSSNANDSRSFRDYAAL